MPKPDVVGMFAVRKTVKVDGMDKRVEWVCGMSYRWSITKSDRLVFALKSQAVKVLTRYRRYNPCNATIALVRIKVVPNVT